MKTCKKNYQANTEKHDTPEISLIAAIIRRALQDANVLHTQNMRDRKAILHYTREARRWLLSRSTARWSFMWCANIAAKDKADDLIDIVRRRVRQSIVCLLILLGLGSVAAAQVPNEFKPRPVQLFKEGQERECELHWLHDLTILRQWQQESAYWRGIYNGYAHALGYPPELDTGHPTLNQYEVSENVIQEDFENPDKYYSRFIDACNAHIVAAHITEAQFAQVVWVQRNYVCAARNTLAQRGFVSSVPCDSRFAASFPYEFVNN